MIRQLSEMLLEVTEALVPDVGGIVGVRSAEINLPMEVQFRKSGGNIELLADVPRWRWTTDFDARPGRIELSLHREVAS